MSDKGFYFRLPDRQRADLRDVAAQADLKVAELLRRMIDAVRTPVVFNHVVPGMSGQLLGRN